MVTDILEAEKYTIAELAEMTGRHVHTIKMWIKRGVGGMKLTRRKIGGRVFVLRSDLEEFLRAINE